MNATSRPPGLSPHECIWSDDQGRPWFVRATFGLVGERVEVVGMEVRSARLEHEDRLTSYLPTPQDGQAAPLSSSTWRAMHTLVADLRHSYVTALDGSGFLAELGNETARARWLAPKDRVEARLEEVAAIYTAAVEAGDRTTAAVSKHFDLSPSAAAKRVQRARSAGLLPPAKRGRRRAGPAGLSMLESGD